MPRYAPDRELLYAIQTYVREVHGGVVKRAANVLHLDYIMLRRFLDQGCAKPENRLHIENALMEADWPKAKDHKIAHKITIEFTRSMLKQLLDALDAYEAGHIRTEAKP